MVFGFLFLAIKNATPLALFPFFTKRHKFIDHNLLFFPKYKKPKNGLKSTPNNFCQLLSKLFQIFKATILHHLFMYSRGIGSCETVSLTLSGRRSLSYRKQSIDLLCKLRTSVIKELSNVTIGHLRRCDNFKKA